MSQLDRTGFVNKGFITDLAWKIANHNVNSLNNISTLSANLTGNKNKENYQPQQSLD